MGRFFSELGIIDYCMCLFLALSFSASGYYIETGDCNITLGFLLTALVWIAVLIVLAAIIRFSFANACFQSSYNGRSEAIVKVFAGFNQLMNGKYHVFIVAGVIFICWLPVLIWLYPGTCINDTWDELRQYIGFESGSVQLSDHHPIFDTFLMGTMIVPLAKLTGSWHIVMFGYVMLQAACTSIAFSYTIDYGYNKLDINAKYMLIVLSFYCLAPIYPASVQTISKDALFAWIFVFFFTCCIEIVRSKGECLKDVRFLAVFTIISVLCCLTKKVGFYVVLISLICYLLFHRDSRRRIIIPTTCVVLVMIIVMPIVQNALDVKPGGKQEMFSIPFQMTARYVKNCSDEIGEDEKVIIDKVLDYENLAELYDPLNADPVKQYDQKGDDSDYTAYLVVWAKEGTRHPKIYMSALNAMLAGWFSFHEYKPIMNMDWHSQLDIKVIPEWVPERDISEISANAYQEAFDNCYNNPLLRIFLTYGLYSALVPAFAIGTVFRKRSMKNSYWLATMPLLLSLFLGCWLAPLSIHFEGVRYLYPLAYTAPLLIMWCIYIYKTKVIEDNRALYNKEKH